MAEAVYAEKALAPTQSLKEAAAVEDQIKNTATSGKTLQLQVVATEFQWLVMRMGHLCSSLRKGKQHAENLAPVWKIAVKDCVVGWPFFLWWSQAICTLASPQRTLCEFNEIVDFAGFEFALVFQGHPEDMAIFSLFSDA
jgi:hypothetical protein